MTFKIATFVSLVLIMNSGLLPASDATIGSLNSGLMKLAADFTVVKSHIPPSGPHYEKILRHSMMGVFGRWHRLNRQMDQLAPRDRDTLLARYSLLRSEVEGFEARAHPGVETKLSSSFNGRIEGKIVGPDDAPIDAEVIVHNTCGTISGYSYTDEDGNYEVEDLPTGDYYLIADAYGYIGELYDNITCSQGNCNPYRGTPVAVVDGSTTSGIDFALRVEGSISGTVTANGSPMEYFEIEVYDEQGYWAGYGYGIDDFGHYRVAGLDTGIYFALAYNWSGFINQIYNSIPCVDRYCSNLMAGTPISVILGDDTGSINFNLHPLASIAGVITDATTGQPLQDVYVYAFNEEGWRVNYARTNKKGKYLIDSLYQGRYYVLTSNDQGYQDELFDNILCPDWSCDVLTGHQVIVDPGEKKTKIRFQLSH